MQQWYFTVVQGAVTVALLVTAFMFRDNAHIPDLIIGAVISQWLREGIYVGQTLSRNSPVQTVHVPIPTDAITAVLHTAEPPVPPAPGNGA